MNQPLAGRRILVTRARHQAGKLSDGLRALGAEPVEVPVLEIQPPQSYAPLDEALRNLTIYDWLILTSANTVRSVVERTAALGISPREGRLPEIAAVGAATANAARDAGLDIAVLPREYVAESLVEALAGRVANRRILLARAEIARDVIPDALRAGGAAVDVVDAYRNGVPAQAPELLWQALARPIAAAAFTSSSTASHLAEAATRAGIAFPLAGVQAVSIGPVTSQTLRDLGWPPAIEADPHDIPGLIAALTKLLQRV
ncbi:uroporphyrinogen-III synthase [Occallatibacter riparius]|uniref:Uroporphyrinogen-III synthase n=1 Tax=Occallatibacter riparius TaxID=1002689 RepID=A0A9J7BHZ8_9BACT|nr:uroporphyrinogen-III synthase [Occallatibacter riparius]UWZ82424.1 uroporphyrinogen-III synthase [Occallatibacter riparius]